MSAILLPLATGFEEVEAVSLIDVLRRGGIDVRIAHLDGDMDTEMVLGANGITIKADTSIAVKSLLASICKTPCSSLFIFSELKTANKGFLLSASNTFKKQKVLHFSF